MKTRIIKRYVDLPDGQMHCRTVDGVEPAILFLHQTACSAKSYDPLLEELNIPNRLIAIDTPGFGGSFDPEGDLELTDYANWILQTADALGVSKFHVFGHHTGTSLAMLLAARRPDRVISIMLAGAELMTPEERAEFKESHGREPIHLRRDGAHLLENWNYAAGYNPEVDVEILHDEVVAMLRAWKARPRAYMAVAKQDTPALAREVKQPVLLLTSPDDYFNSQLDRPKALFPDAPIAVTGGANFQATADPQGVARAVEKFIAGQA